MLAMYHVQEPPSPRGIEGPMGITAKMIRAGTSDITGARVCTQGLAWEGVMSSLRASLIPSAIGCSSPKGPTRLGPRRTCIRPITRRSVQVM